MLTWGYAGGLYTFRLNNPDGLIASNYVIGGVQGGDTQNKQAIAKCVYDGAKSDQSYDFSIVNLSGGRGASNNRVFTVKCFRKY